MTDKFEIQYAEPMGYRIWGMEIDMKIIYEDKDIIVVEKPAGQLVQSGKNFEMDLTSEVQNYRKRNKEEAYAAVINRLDRPVGGIVLFAKNKKAAAVYSKKMADKAFCKQYYAIICGKPDDKKESFVDYLVKDERNNISQVSIETDENAKRAELMYEVIKTVVTERGEYSLVKIELITGRHHQIRVQFASRQLPLVGDTKYGSEYFAERNSLEEVRAKFGIKRGQIALFATKLSVDDKEYEAIPQWVENFNYGELKTL